jgi:hypothetical protein
VVEEAAEALVVEAVAVEVVAVAGDKQIVLQGYNR